MKRTAVILSLAVLAGCAAHQQRLARQEIEAHSAICRNAIYTPAIEPLMAKAPLDPRTTPTLEHMADRTYPNDVEKAAILAYDKVMVECTNGLIPLYEKHVGPEYAAVIRQSAAQAQEDRVSLYLGKITFGEATTRAVARRNALMSTVAALDQQRRRDAAQQQAASAASLGAGVAAMNMLTGPAFRPMNCTSMQVGTTTQTTCR